MRIKDFIDIYENETEPSTPMNDHLIDCHMISRDEEVDSDEEAQG